MCVLLLCAAGKINPNDPIALTSGVIETPPVFVGQDAIRFFQYFEHAVVILVGSSVRVPLASE